MDPGEIYPVNIVDLFKILLRDCPIFLNMDEISEFIKLSVERNVHNLVIKII